MNDDVSTEDVLAGGWGDREFEIGGTQFKIAKLKAMEAYRVIEMARPELDKAAGLDVPEKDEKDPKDQKAQDDPFDFMDEAAKQSADQLNLSPKVAGTLLHAVLAISPGLVERVRRILFSKITFTNDRAVTPQVLTGAEEVAFDKIDDPLIVHKILVRSVIVNFFGSSRAAA